MVDKFVAGNGAVWAGMLRVGRLCDSKSGGRCLLLL